MDTELGPLSDELIRAVESLSEVFAARSIRYAVIGGLATFMRGRVRFTKDVDILLDVPQTMLPELLDDLVARGFTLDPAIVIKEYVRDHITSFPFGQVRIDWLKPILPLYAHALSSAGPRKWSEGHLIQVVTSEGLILTKMVSFRPQDQTDIETLLTANRDKIDVHLIRAEWAPFAAMETERTAWLESVIAKRVVRRE